MSSQRTRLSAKGEIALPDEIMQCMGLRLGDEVILEWSEQDQELRVSTRRLRLMHARKLAMKYSPPGDSVVDAFINERRADSERSIR